jgi:2-polyprenyl-3-methyl-5-hydroxy-6-metoxy-1,4-benzoquinol methylase
VSRAAGDRIRSERDAEEFYRSSWRSRRWGSTEPNDDERSRLSAIMGLLEACDLPERPQILDLGCGRGWLTRALAYHGDVVGTDLVAAAIDRARELHPDLSFEHVDLDGLVRSRGEAAFDLVVSSEVLEHVKDAEKVPFLEGIRRLLKPRGCAILTTPRGELWEQWMKGRDWQQPVEEWVTEHDLDRMATGVGFVVEQRTRAHVYGITPLGRLFVSRPFRLVLRWLPFLEGLTHGSRIYQVVRLRHPGVGGETPP